MDDCNLDEKSLSKWQYLQHSKLIISNKNSQRMKNNIKFTFSVGGTTQAVYNKDWARQIELVTLKTIFRVLYMWKICSVQP